MKVQQLFDVQGDVTFITGGARGMGQAFAEVMAANGARIALYDIDGPALEEAAAALRATGAEVLTTQGDVVDTEERPIPGLFAAGELEGGIFYFNYPGGSGLTNGTVFGRIAGRSAAKSLG